MLGNSTSGYQILTCHENSITLGKMEGMQKPVFIPSSSGLQKTKRR
jgi:hypothetical protein